MKKINGNKCVNNEVNNANKTVNVFFPYAVFDSNDEVVCDDEIKVQLKEGYLRILAWAVKENDFDNISLDKVPEVASIVEQCVTTDVIPDIAYEADEDPSDYYCVANDKLPESLLYEELLPYLSQVWVKFPVHMTINGKSETHVMRTKIPTDLFLAMKNVDKSGCKDMTDIAILMLRDYDAYEKFMYLMEGQASDFAKTYGAMRGQITEFPYEVYEMYDVELM